MQTERPAESLFRELPAVSEVLGSQAFQKTVEAWGAPLATDLLREELGRVREAIREGRLDPAAVRARSTPGALAARVDAAASALLSPSPRTVVNATGVVVHTNLGRAILSERAARRLAESASAYMDLELDLGRGERGSRMAHLAPLLARIFPGQAFHVANNNAAAILLALRAAARGKDVVVSRGELVEIGGSFRVPDILAASGARLREVGTTNRTRLSDYEAAIGGRTGALLKVHTSNFRIVGFAEETTIAELAGLAARSGVPLIVDWGSGDLADLAPLGIRDELPVARILADGADLVTFSGDKLLGGPQAGFLVGRKDLVEKARGDPMARVCRIDRLLVTVLRETLLAYVTRREMEEIPTLRMLALEPGSIESRARAVAARVAATTGAGGRLSIIDGVSRTGGGSSPTGERPTRLLAVEAVEGDAGGLEQALRAGDPPVLARVQEGKLLLDLRTVLPSQDERLAERLRDVLSRERRAAAAKPGSAGAKPSASGAKQSAAGAKRAAAGAKREERKTAAAARPARVRRGSGR